MWQPSADLAAALVGSERVTSFRFDVIDETGAVLDTLTPADEDNAGILGGQVTCSTDGIRWTGAVTVVGETLIPLRVGDLLHPLTYNRIKPWVRVRLADGTWGEIPLAPMYVDAMPSLQDSGLTPDVEATLSLSDAVALIKRAGWRTPKRLGGMTCHTAVKTIINEVAPWLTVVVTNPAVSTTLPSEYDVGEPGGDPWADVETICQAGDLVAYVDRDGVMRVEARPTTTAVRWAFNEGADDCLMVDVSADVDLAGIDSVVAVQSDSEDVDPPVVGWWEDEDPTSPLYTGGGHYLFSGIRTNPAVTTQSQAASVAERIGATMRAATQTVVISAVPVPVLDPHDVVDVARERIGVGGLCEVQSWTVTFDPTDLMALTATGRVDL